LKTYFIGLLLLMLGFTGFLFFKRPGAFQELMSAGKIPVSLASVNTNIIKNKLTSPKESYPYFSFISGDVLLNTEAQSYLAQTNISLRKKDKIMVSFNSFAILMLGPEKYLRLGEGTKITYERRPRRNRGFYEFRLEKGKLFADFFASKRPIGLKIHLPKNSVSMQDATIRLRSTVEGEFLSSLDRGESQFYIPSSAQFFKVQAGFGAHNKDGIINVGDFSWVDKYPWDEHINGVTKKGYGLAATFKATPLSKRPRKVSKQEQQVTWNKKQRPRARRKPSKAGESNGVAGMLKKVGKSATEGLKNVITAPTKITESKESIQNFEKLQNERAQALDAIE
jgi:hypothetical protein